MFYRNEWFLLFNFASLLVAQSLTIFILNIPGTSSLHLPVGNHQHPEQFWALTRHYELARGQNITHSWDQSFRKFITYRLI